MTGIKGGLRAMREVDEFRRRVVTILERFFRQNSRTVPSREVLEAVAGRLAVVVEQRGLPPPLAPGDCGAPGSLGEEVCAPLVAQVLGRESEPLLADAAKQLVKACFYPEFTVCRDSYRELARDGSCRRQELNRVRGRISGTHCVDCPHWVALEPQKHAEMVAEAWLAGRERFERERAVVLPEDFRALRLWLWRAAREQ